MKKLKMLSCLLVLVFSFQYYVCASGDNLGVRSTLFQKSVSNVKETDMFKNILEKTNSTPVECGIMATFNTFTDKEKVVDEIFKVLMRYSECNKKVWRNNKIYCIEFNGYYEEGYVEGVENENYNIITVNITRKSSQYKLQDLKSMIDRSLGDRKEKCKYFEYVKAKTQKQDVSSVNSKVKNILKCYGTSDIKTIALEEGYSSTAYTHKYEPIQSVTGLIDFNYAVVKYDTGTYIIMGTPEIMVTY
ncbi:YwmB family TATA-box binding protein [Clostridium coskatii]|uniref:YwmB family TATA-box binding protein n=1 Tax=Clostridium coskatii TaxID=1705578 RepID=UPI0007BEBA32|nr:YwmB family TATA-box binding protein [Clostridium coskatii]